MKDITVRVRNDFYADLEELGRSLDTSIPALIPYALEKAFYEELDEIFCLRSVRRSLKPRPIESEDGHLSSKDYRRRHDLRQKLIDAYTESLPYPQDPGGVDELQTLSDQTAPAF